MDAAAILTTLLKLRNIIVVSLVLQSTLTVIAPLRKKISSPAASTFLWAVYTLAGLAPVYAMGLVTTAAIQKTGDTTLTTLWAPLIFLLVVGPDTISAFSLDDTRSWIRTGYPLLLTAVAATRVTFIPFRFTWFALAAYAVTAASVLKICETMHCFFIGNLYRTRTFTRKLHETSPDDVIIGLTSTTDHKLHHIDVVRDAFALFHMFKGIFANVIFPPHVRTRSRGYFLARDAEEAFAVAETELNFVYDILFTKKLVLTWRFGQLFRLTTIVLELTPLLIWVSVNKSGFDKDDVRLTYNLFAFAFAYEFMFLVIHLLSNWTIASVLLKRSLNYNSFKVKFIHSLAFFKAKVWFFSGRRWSESVPRFSIIMWCTSKSSPGVEKALDLFKIKDLVYNCRNMSSRRFNDKLRDRIFDELRYRSLKAEDERVAKQMFSARGNWILHEYYHDNPLVLKLADAWFPQSMEFDRIVIVWHVATELCYYVSPNDNEEKEVKEFSKVISDYMAYILVREQTMLSEVASEAKATFQKMCNEVAMMFINHVDMEGLKGKEEKVEKVCRMIMSSKDDHEVEVVDDGIRNSVLQGAVKLSMELQVMRDEGINIWEVMSKVWGELLCYAAFKCKASEHAAQLCKGGQLLTIVWLLMAHLGLINRFEHLD